MPNQKPLCTTLLPKYDLEMSKSSAVCTKSQFIDGFAHSRPFFNQKECKNFKKNLSSQSKA